MFAMMSSICALFFKPAVKKALGFPVTYGRAFGWMFNIICLFTLLVMGFLTVMSYFMAEPAPSELQNQNPLLEVLNIKASFTFEFLLSVAFTLAIMIPVVKWVVKRDDKSKINYQEAAKIQLWYGVYTLPLYALVLGTMLYAPKLIGEAFIAEHNSVQSYIKISQTEYEGFLADNGHRPKAKKDLYTLDRKINGLDMEIVIDEGDIAIQTHGLTGFFGTYYYVYENAQWSCYFLGQLPEQLTLPGCQFEYTESPVIHPSQTVPVDIAPVSTESPQPETHDLSLS
jgi:hypothetical protein